MHVYSIGKKYSLVLGDIDRDGQISDGRTDGRTILVGDNIVCLISVIHLLESGFIPTFSFMNLDLKDF